ncbi:MAG: alpha/beta fold hydrolase, partial [Candidatus Viridilinea halotolerans]
MNRSTYTTALTLLDQQAAREAALPLNPCCRSFALTHGRRTARCVVLLHGYTNCPQQFRRFAEAVYQQGHNVYVPRMPHHGMADRLSAALGNFSRAALLTEFAATFDLAHALGERVDLLGLSAGANLAAYAAQYRNDIHQAIIISPVLGSYQIHPWLTAFIALTSSIMPNRFLWWDETLRERGHTLLHTYPRFGSRALGCIAQLGLEVLAAARTKPHRARDVVVVINPSDEAVTVPPIERLIARWRAQAAPLRTYYFPAELKLIHDLIDPEQELQQVD